MMSHLVVTDGGCVYLEFTDNIQYGSIIDIFSLAN